MCQFCNNSGSRAACGGEWEDAGGSCLKQQYDLDGLCDCGCGALDPDCEQGDGCTEPGCDGPGCEVCHNRQQILVCHPWTCDIDKYDADDGCDCGCGSRDPDCGNWGCGEPGCSVDIDDPIQCDACYDPLGREVACP
jgi:hypothetical protein